MDTQVVAIQVWPLQIPLRSRSSTLPPSGASPIPSLSRSNWPTAPSATARPSPDPTSPARPRPPSQAALASVLLEALVDARPQSMPGSWNWSNPCPGRTAITRKLPGRPRRPGTGPAGRLQPVLSAGYPGTVRVVRRARLRTARQHRPRPPRIVLGSAEPRKVLRQIRLARLCGIRDFKLKMGDKDIDRDIDRLKAVLTGSSGDLEAGGSPCGSTPTVPGGPATPCTSFPLPGPADRRGRAADPLRHRGNLGGPPRGQRPADDGR